MPGSGCIPQRADEPSVISMGMGMAIARGVARHTHTNTHAREMFRGWQGIGPLPGERARGRTTGGMHHAEWGAVISPEGCARGPRWSMAQVAACTVALRVRATFTVSGGSLLYCSESGHYYRITVNSPTMTPDLTSPFRRKVKCYNFDCFPLVTSGKSRVTGRPNLPKKIVSHRAQRVFIKGPNWDTVQRKACFLMWRNPY